MRQIRLHVNLQECNDFLSGIGTFENELVRRLMKFPEILVGGGYNEFKKKADLSRFDFDIHFSRIPYRFLFPTIYSQNIVEQIFGKFFRLFSYNQIMRDKESEVFLFFSYRLPVCRIKGKTIVCIHDLIALKVGMEEPEIKDRYLKIIRSSIRRAELVITVSEASKRDLLQQFDFLTEDRLRVVHNAVNVDDYRLVNHEELERVREKYHLPSRYILYFGSSRKHKNVESIVRAYGDLDEGERDDVKLVITNPSDNLKELAASLGLSDDVMFIANIPDEDKCAIYKLAHIFVFVSLYEGFGIPVLEAMAADVPVITSNTSSLPEVAGDAALLVEPLDVAGISGCMRRLIGDKELREQMIRRGRENLLRFSWDKSAQQIRDILIDIS